MINYPTSLWGFQILFRLHGSALYKAFLPACVSTAILLAVYFARGLDFDDRFDYRVFDHPYALGVFMVAFTFLLTFKASFSYNRYWEACTAVHQMHSKWLDVGIEMAAFHYQSNAYKAIKPPAFGEHPEIRSIRRERDRFDEMSGHALEMHLESVTKKNLFQKVFGLKGKKRQRRRKSPGKNINDSSNFAVGGTGHAYGPGRNLDGRTKSKTKMSLPKRKIDRLTSVIVLDGGIKTKEPALFLQELAHLLSLLSAVAFSTLRNDSEEADSPLITFLPGRPWQPVDPDDVNLDNEDYIRRDYYRSRGRFWLILGYLLGFGRDEKSKALYNCARPFRVIGGVSDAEIQKLQRARGPLAKVSLCSMWLQEFISREYMNGSTGGVAPPIISRLFQYTSDGTVGYNQARKVAYIPFPFPHNQVTSFFVLYVIVYLPVLFLTYLRVLSYSIVMNFFTVLCFVSLYEVARELERPFQNVPNDLPLNNFQHQFNEALLTMYSGFHPDAWWEVEGKVETPHSVLEPREESRHPSQASQATELQKLDTLSEAPAEGGSAEAPASQAEVGDRGVVLEIEEEMKEEVET